MVPTRVTYSTHYVLYILLLGSFSLWDSGQGHNLLVGTCKNYKYVLLSPPRHGLERQQVLPRGML